MKEANLAGGESASANEALVVELVAQTFQPRSIFCSIKAAANGKKVLCDLVRSIYRGDVLKSNTSWEDNILGEDTLRKIMLSGTFSQVRYNTNSHTEAALVV